MSEKVDVGELIDAIRQVTAYLWDSEHGDFMHGPAENRENHIFEELKKLDSFLETVAAWNFPRC